MDISSLGRVRLAALRTRRVGGHLRVRFILTCFAVLLLAACSDDSALDTPGAASPNPPSISLSVSSDATGTLTLGDLVTVAIASQEAILAPSVLIAGGAADSVTGSNDSWTARRTMKLEDPNGAVSVEVNYLDLGGTPGTAVSIATNLMYQKPDAYQLVWEDTFDGTELDTARWNIQTGDGTSEGLPRGWGNNEQQLYNADQISVANGMLTITAERGTSPTDYVYARINTKDKVDFTYGRIIVRAKLPEGQGIWPAIWMLSTDDVYGPWPQSGEIDIVEATNLGVNGKKTFQSVIHYGFPWPDNSFNAAMHDPSANPQDGFHNYMMEWEPNEAGDAVEMRFYFDGAHYATHNSDNWFTVTENADGSFTRAPSPAPFNQDFHLLMNVAVGGNLPGAPDSTTTFPQTLEVDHVRLYRCAYATADDPCSGTVDDTIAATGGAGSVNLNTWTLYDGERAGPLTFTIRGETQVNELQIDSFDSGSAVAANDPDAMDPAGTRDSVWRLQIMGGAGNAYISSEDLSMHAVLDTGFDLGADADDASKIIFDMYVDELSDGTSLLVKLDSGYPNLSEATVPDIAMDAWKTYSIPIRDLTANPAGNGVDLGNVANPFVIEPANATAANISADIYLDNIRLAFACVGGRSCQLRPKLKAISGTLAVFDDALNSSVWTAGFSAFDQALSFSSCTNDNGAGCPSIAWNIVDAADTTRGKVIEVTYSGTQFAGLVIGGPQMTAIDLSSYAGGTVQFDLNVTANPSSVPIRMKVDCARPTPLDDNNPVCHTNAGQREQDLGTPALNTWTEISIAIDDMVNANGGPTSGGLVLDKVTTGLVIFPPFGMTAGVSFQVDNVRWEEGSGTTPPPAIPVGTGAVYADAVDSQWDTNMLAAFDQAISFSSCTDDGGAGCPSIGWTVEDVAGRGKVIEVTYSGTQFAGLIVGQTTTGLDMSAFAGGTVQFDLNVTANPSSVPMRMKVDCVRPTPLDDNNPVCNTNAGQREQDLGMPGTGWKSYSVNVDDMVNANGGPTSGGLKLDMVTTGLVIFPPFNMTEGIVYQLDNVRWVKSSP
ncbi:MAG: glycoside hydrolase family 16 protein [Pseudomonadales bacterium]